MALVLTSIGFAVGVRAAGHATTPVVFVATGEEFPDGFGAGPAAALNRGPVLLVRQNSIPAQTAAEPTRLSPDRTIVVGGPAAISNAVESQLAAYAPDVDRLGGSDRYGTAAEISKEFFPATLDDLGIGMYVARETHVVPANKVDWFSADCEAGDQATGGGYSVLGPPDIRQSRPLLGSGGVPESWEIWVDNDTSSPESVTVEVVCMHMTP